MGGLSYIFWANGLRERELELSVAKSLTQCVLVLSLFARGTILAPLGGWTGCLLTCVCMFVCVRVCACVCACVCCVGVGMVAGVAFVICICCVCVAT